MTGTNRRRLLSSEQHFEVEPTTLYVVCMVVLLYDLILIVASVVILISSGNEKPPVQIRDTIIYGVILLFLQLCCTFYGLCPDTCTNDIRNPTVALRATNLLLAVPGFVWWVIGLKVLIVGGHPLLIHAPQLFWLTATLLAMPVIALVVIVCCVCCATAISVIDAQRVPMQSSDV